MRRFQVSSIDMSMQQMSWRSKDVAETKRTAEYKACKGRSSTPDPLDNRISRRAWNIQLTNWRYQLRICYQQDRRHAPLPSNHEEHAPPPLDTIMYWQSVASYWHHAYCTLHDDVSTKAIAGWEPDHAAVCGPPENDVPLPMKIHVNCDS